MYDFDQAFDRTGTDVIKWDRIEQDFGKQDLLPFGIADMDFKVLPQLQQALIERAEHPTYGYTFPSDNYFNQFIKWNLERNNFVINREDIIVVPGIVCACCFIIDALTKPGDKVMINTPIYDPFFHVIEEQNRQTVTSSLIRQQGQYTFDFADMEEKMKDGVKLLILCNPHNPVGRVWTKKELATLVSLCDKYQVYIFSDEIHSDLIFKGLQHKPLLDIAPEAERLTVLAMAPSKTFNIAGLKSSFLVARDPQIRARVSQAIQRFHVGVNLFGLKATEVVYETGGQWRDELVAYLYENAVTVHHFMQQKLPRVTTYVPDGTYLMWLDFSAYGLSQEQLMQRMIDQAGVAVHDGTHYGREGTGFVRMNIGTQRNMLVQALERIYQAFS